MNDVMIKMTNVKCQQKSQINKNMRKQSRAVGDRERESRGRNREMNPS